MLKRERRRRYIAQPPGPQPGLPQPPQGRSATGRLPPEATGAAGTLNCFSNFSLPQLGQAGFSLDRTNSSKAAPQAAHWYSYNGIQPLPKNSPAGDAGR